jgi:hypothetical protein
VTVAALVPVAAKEHVAQKIAIAMIICFIEIPVLLVFLQSPAAR